MLIQSDSLRRITTAMQLAGATTEICTIGVGGAMLNGIVALRVGLWLNVSLNQRIVQPHDIVPASCHQMRIIAGHSEGTLIVQDGKITAGNAQWNLEPLGSAPLFSPVPKRNAVTLTVAKEPFLHALAAVVCAGGGDVVVTREWEVWKFACPKALASATITDTYANLHTRFLIIQRWASALLAILPSFGEKDSDITLRVDGEYVFFQWKDALALDQVTLAFPLLSDATIADVPADLQWIGAVNARILHNAVAAISASSKPGEIPVLTIGQSLFRLDTAMLTVNFASSGAPLLPAGQRLRVRPTTAITRWLQPDSDVDLWLSDDHLYVSGDGGNTTAVWEIFA